MEVVVLGCHASGTSLVSHMLIELGVSMGDRFLGKMKGIPVWEDGDFVRCNSQILKLAGGNWGNPPSQGRIRAACNIPHLAKRIETLVSKKQKRKIWGWKDPRTSLTIEAYHQHLKDPYYIYVQRGLRQVAKSILRRGPSAKTLHQWIKVASTYNERIASFINKHPGGNFLNLSFADLVDESKAREQAKNLVEFIELGNINDALSVIEYRKG